MKALDALVSRLVHSADAGTHTRSRWRPASARHERFHSVVAFQRPATESQASSSNRPDIMLGEGHQLTELRPFSLACAVLLSAQYFFILSETALLAAADIVRARFRACWAACLTCRRR
jgi:hypothetical protein